MIRVTARITGTLAVLAALTLAVLLIAGRPQAPEPDTHPTFAASAPTTTTTVVTPQTV